MPPKCSKSAINFAVAGVHRLGGTSADPDPPPRPMAPSFLSPPTLKVLRVCDSRGWGLKLSTFLSLAAPRGQGVALVPLKIPPPLPLKGPLSQGPVPKHSRK